MAFQVPSLTACVKTDLCSAHVFEGGRGKGTGQNRLIMWYPLLEDCGGDDGYILEGG
jgi:hypothetical protein